VKFIYSEWNEQLYQALKDLSDLMAIYHYLLMRMNGDVEETLRLMERLQQQGVLDEKYDLEQFKDMLKNSEMVHQTQQGLKLSPKGERGLRKDAFNQIFERMKASGKGNHPLPYEGAALKNPARKT